MENRMLDNTLKKLFEGNEKQREKAVESIANVLEYAYKDYYREQDLEKKGKELELIRVTKSQITSYLASKVEQMGDCDLTKAVRSALVDMHIQYGLDENIYRIDQNKKENELAAEIRKKVGYDIWCMIYKMDEQFAIEREKKEKSEMAHEDKSIKMEPVEKKPTLLDRLKKRFSNNRQKEEKKEELRREDILPASHDRPSIGIPNLNMIGQYQPTLTNATQNSGVRRPVPPLPGENFEPAKPVGYEYRRRQEQWYQMPQNGSAPVDINKVPVPRATKQSNGKNKGDER